MKYAILAMMLVGCGPGFTGTYSGPAHIIATCPSGFGIARTNSLTWSLSQADKNISISAVGGTCNSIAAVVSDENAPDTATILDKTCPTLSDGNGGTITEVMVDGEMTLDNSGDLLFEIRGLELLHVPGTPDETCPSAFFGLLTRQK